MSSHRKWDSHKRQKAIFDHFIQSDIKGKMAQQGAGLGLAISKAYVEMLGGKIWVESEEQNGSSFILHCLFMSFNWAYY